MHTVRAAVATVAILVLGSALAACSPDPDAGSDPASDRSDRQPRSASGHGFPRTITHAMGETTIPEKPKRIVTLDASFTEAAIALHADVVGYVNYGGTSKLPDYLGTSAQRYAGDAVSVGELEQPSLDRIVALHPDLIVSAKVRHADLYGKLSKIAPTVFSETTGATWKQNIRLLGKALGKSELADREIAAYEKRAKRIGDEIRAKESRNPTMSLVRFVGGPTVRLYTLHSFPGIVQADTGLARPRDAPDDPDSIMVELSQENILQLDADQIFVSTWTDETGDSAKGARRFRANPLWDRLQGKQHTVDDTVWFTSVSLQGAQGILDDLAKAFGVDPAR